MEQGAPMLVVVTYVVAGLILPLFYVPQLRALCTDTTHLESYSISTSTVQLGCRVVMMPFVAITGNATMITIVGLDLAARGVIVLAAAQALRRQGWTWREVVRRFALLDFTATSRQRRLVAAQPEPEALTRAHQDLEGQLDETSRCVTT